MKHSQRGILPLLMICVGLAIVVMAPATLGQKSRSRVRDKTTGLIKWADWKPLKCERCLGKRKMDCGTCNAGRKDLGVKCGECSGKKKSDCRECYGKGIYADPFVTCPCDRCEGRGTISCFMCGGKGQFFHSDGKKGAKCRTCSKKGFFKCWSCKGSGAQDFLQPEGAGYAAASEVQLKEVQKIIKPLYEKLDSFTGIRAARQDPKSAKTIYREEDYKDVLKEVIDVFPQFKNDMKKTISLGAKAAKQRGVSGTDKAPGRMLRRSAGAIQIFMERHMNTIRVCLSVYTDNRRQQELKKRQQKEAGGTGK